RLPAAGDVDVVLLNQPGVFGGQAAAQGLANQLRLAGRKMQEGTIAVHRVGLRFGVGELAVWRAIAGALVLILFLALGLLCGRGVALTVVVGLAFAFLFALAHAHVVAHVARHRWAVLALILSRHRISLGSRGLAGLNGRLILGGKRGIERIERL